MTSTPARGHPGPLRRDAGAAGEVDSVLEGGGECGAVMRAVDWSRTPVGPVSAWPQSLRTMLRMILTSRFPMFLWWGPELVQFYNDGYRPSLGATRHPDAMGKRGREFWTDIWDVIGPEIDGVMASGQSTWHEDALIPIQRDGRLEEVFWTYSYSPVWSEDGAVAGTLVVCSETTEQVRALRRMATLRDLSAAAVGPTSAAEAVGAAVRVLGQNPSDLPFALAYLVDREDGAAALAAVAGLTAGTAAAPVVVEPDPTGRAGGWPIAAALADGGPVEVADLRKRFGDLPGGPWPEPAAHALLLPIVPAGHATRGVLVAGLSPRVPLDDAYRSFLGLVAGQIAAAVGAAAAREAERTRADALAELDRAKTAFFSNVSHEFRTPLTLMLGPIDDLLAGSDDRVVAADRAQLVAVHRNCLRLLRLVNTLLDVARIEAGRVEAVYEPTDLPALTAELASAFRSAVERAGLRFVVDCPPLPTDAEVYVDRAMWEKIVLNLLSNALKFTFEGEIAVSLRVADDGQHAALIVRDTGTGIPAEEMPHLFDRFHRVVGASSRTHEGTGIGLALVRELARLHGGDVGVTSAVGAGTTFTVSLPLGSSHLPAERIGPGRTQRSTAVGAAAYVEEAMGWLPGSGDPPLAAPGGLEPADADAARSGSAGCVLLADDNADMRAYVGRLLRDAGFAVEAVADGAAALEAARARRPDLVVSDVMMPVLDGFALLRALRADPGLADVPVVLLSARAGEEARVAGVAAGPDDYLVKPFAAQELVARVRTHVVLGRQRREAARLLARAHAEAEAERARLADWIANAPAFITALQGPEHVFALANARYMELVGPGRDLIGRPLREALPEVVEQGFVDLLDRVYASGEPFVGREMAVWLDRRGDGTLDEAMVDFVYQPTRGPNGRIEGILVHGVEVTEQVRARRRVEELAAENGRLYAEAEAALRARDQFLSIASHELRTPVTSIRGYAQMIERSRRRDDLDVERLDRAIATIRDGAERLVVLTQDLLDVSRIQGGHLALRLAPLDLRAVIADAVRARQDDLAGRHAVRTELPERDCVVVADRTRLDQVIANLLDNALKYSPAGGSVTIALQADDDGATVRVADEGIGVPTDMLERVFEPFGRAANAADSEVPGMGLGLFICRNIVALHGGRIWAQSSGPGQGTTVSFWLPRAVDDQTAN